MRYSSYAGSAGTWFNDIWANYYSPPTGDTIMNGVFYAFSVTRLATITDGTSNTFLFGEHARTNLMTYDPGFAMSDGQWNSGRIYDTMFATWYPPNVGLTGSNSGRSLPSTRKAARSWMGST